ncbi:unknown [Clostridium sp. CAG:413]|nr:unknown [Clostridium sp. CAG:413]
MKKFIAILLAAATLAATSIPAFAENEEVTPAEQNVVQQVEPVEEKEEKTEIETPAPSEEKAEETLPVEEAPVEQPAEPAEQEEMIPDEQPEAPEISSEEIKNFLASDEVKSALREAGLDEDEIEDMTENPEPRIKYITRAEYERMRIDDAMIGFMYGVEEFSIALEGVLGILVSTPLFLAFPIAGPFLMIIFIAGVIPITVGAFAAGVGLTVASPVIVLVRYIKFELPDNYVVVK